MLRRPTFHQPQHDCTHRRFDQPRTHHTRSQLMQDLKGGFVSAQTKLALELYRRHTGRHGRDQVGAPEPCRKRGMRALHDRASRQSNVLLTTTTAQHTGTIGKPIRITNHAAVRASKSGVPTNSFQVRSTRRIVGKQSLEFRQRPRERKRCTVEDVRRHLPPSMAWISGRFQSLSLLVSRWETL